MRATVGQTPVYLHLLYLSRTLHCRGVSPTPGWRPNPLSGIGFYFLDFSRVGEIMLTSLYVLLLPRYGKRKSRAQLPTFLYNLKRPEMYPRYPTSLSGARQTSPPSPSLCTPARKSVRYCSGQESPNACDVDWLGGSPFLWVMHYGL